MFKKCLLTFAIMLVSITASAQNYLDGVTSRSCECVQNVPDSETREMKNLQLGLCLLKSFSEEDKSKFKKEFNLDVNNPMRDGRDIGIRLGARMASVCPDQLMRLSKEAQKDTQETGVIGTVTKIENDPFVVFVVKDTNNVMHRFAWITRVNSSLDVSSSYQTYVGKSLSFKFENKDIFDPRIADYRSMKVITEIRQANGK